MSKHVYKSYNVSLLLYYLVFPTKFRRIVIDETVDKQLKHICLEIGSRYEIQFLEIGTDKDHVHLLVQSIPNKSITQLVTIIKSITEKKMLVWRPQLKQELWGSHLWTSGYYVSTVSKHSNETVISQYVRKQGRQHEYTQLHKEQLNLFL